MCPCVHLDERACLCDCVCDRVVLPMYLCTGTCNLVFVGVGVIVITIVTAVQLVS